MQYTYGRIIHVVGSYEGLEQYERDAFAFLRADYLDALACRQVPEDPRQVVVGPAIPIPGPGNQLRHFMAWQVLSDRIRIGSPYYMPEGLARALSVDDGVLGDFLGSPSGYGSGLYGFGGYDGDSCTEEGYGSGPYGGGGYGSAQPSPGYGMTQFGVSPYGV